MSIHSIANEISAEGKIYIYGGGLKGCELHIDIFKIFDKERFGCFLTSGQTYEANDHIVYNFESKIKEIGNNDCIIICSQYSREIINSISEYEINCKIIDAINYVFFEDTRQYSAKAIAKFKTDTDTICEHLHSQQSKELFRQIVDYRYIRDTAERSSKDFYKVLDAHYGASRQIDELHYIEHMPQSGIHFAIEGGAHAGQVSSKIISYFTEIQTLYSFEIGDLENIALCRSEKLQQDLANFQESKKLHFINKALWSETSTLSLNNSSGNSTAFCVTEHNSSNIEVPAISIDDFMQDHALPTLDYIKLDVEGAEPQVLEGALETIKRCRPHMAISIYHSGNQVFTIPLYCIEHLKNYRFEIGHYCNLPCLETILYCIPNE